MGKFVMSKRSNGHFQFNLKADNGLVILTSEGYVARPGCEKGINSVKKHSQSKDNFEQLKATNGKHYFTLKASNGEIIGTSQMYETKAGMVNGLASVIKNAHNAEVMAEM